MGYKNEIVPLILVSNDCYWLPYTLKSIENLFDRYVIYDVGSQDGTQNIIDWFIDRNRNRASFYTRFTPMLPPDIQGIFRNSMIAEAQSEWYFIVDGDEVYHPKQIHAYFSQLKLQEQYKDDRIYGVCRRIEVSNDLTQQYDIERGHHRLYHRIAIWKGTHPGEEPVIQQKERREFNINLRCFHFHNTLRSTHEDLVPKRQKRKSQRSYHPGKLIKFNLLEQLPILQKPIENFPVTPALKKLQDAS